MLVKSILRKKTLFFLSFFLKAREKLRAHMPTVLRRGCLTKLPGTFDRRKLPSSLPIAVENQHPKAPEATKRGRKGDKNLYFYSKNLALTLQIKKILSVR